MTAATERKIRVLIGLTRKNLRKAARVPGEKAPSRSPFVGSAAKYYPALKNLAAK